MPNADGSAATTDIREAHRCVAWLGATSRASTRTSDIPPYDRSVCPQGSTDTSICDPSSSLAATAAAKASGKRARSGDDGGRQRPRRAATRRMAAALRPARGRRSVPRVPTTPAPGADPDPSRRPWRAEPRPPGNDDLLGFLFGN